MKIRKPKRQLYNGEKLKDFRELVNRYKQRYSGKTAFKYKETPNSTEIISISYKTFAEDIESLATSLLQLNLPQKRIAILAPNRYEWCVSYLAITTCGMIVVPLDKALPDNEIESLLKRSEVDAIFYDKKYASVIDKIKEKQETNLQYYICMDNVENTDVSFYSNLIADGNKLLKDGNKDYQNVELDSNKMSIMLFTSGTTSISKAVSLSQANIVADIYSLSCMAKIKAEDTFLSFLPLHHTFESTCTFLYGSSCGITIAFCDGIKYVQKNLEEFAITGFVCVPLLLEVMYKKIQKEIEKQGKTKLIQFMRHFCNFLLKFGIDIRRKVFSPILARLRW